MGKAQRLLLTLVAVAGIGAALVYWYLNSPLYAVKCASDAVRDHDVARFHHFVDVHSVARSAIEDLLAEPIRKSGAGILERVVGITIVSFFEPSSVEAMQKQIDNWVEHHGRQASPNAGDYGLASANNDDDDDAADQPKSLVKQLVALVKPPSLKQIFREYGFTKKNFKGFHQEQQSDNTAHVLLDFNSPKTGGIVSVDLQLAKASGQWQITRVANLQDLVAQLSGP